MMQLPEVINLILKLQLSKKNKSLHWCQYYSVIRIMQFVIIVIIISRSSTIL